MLQSSSSGIAEKVNLCPVPGESLEPALYTPDPRSCSTSLGLKVQLSIRLVIDKHVLARTVFLIRFLSITGFTGSKTHAEKFCRLHSLLSPSEGWGFLNIPVTDLPGVGRLCPGQQPPERRRVRAVRAEPEPRARCPARPCPAAQGNSCRENTASRNGRREALTGAGELGSAECGSAGRRAEECSVRGCRERGAE